MPKQSSIFKIRGKMDGNAFYYSGLGGYQFRKINPNMSSRVKTEDQFLNTRRNAAEFGAAGSMASAVCRANSYLFRYVSSNKLCGELTKLIDGLIRSNTSGTWGQRKVMASSMNQIQEMYNQFSKNQIPGFIKDFIKKHITFDNTNMQFICEANLKSTADFELDLMNKGATGVYFYAYNMVVTNCVYSSALNGYIKCVPYLESLATTRMISPLDGAGNKDIIYVSNAELEYAPQNVDHHCGGMLFTMLPFRTVGGGQTILQDLCAAYWVALEDAD